MARAFTATEMKSMYEYIPPQELPSDNSFVPEDELLKKVIEDLSPAIVR